MFNCDTAIHKYTNKAIAPVAAINTSNTFILSVAVNTMVIKAKILEANTPTYGALVFLPKIWNARGASPRRDKENNMRLEVYKAELKQLHTEVNTTKFTICLA